VSHGAVGVVVVVNGYIFVKSHAS